MLLFTSILLIQCAKVDPLLVNLSNLQVYDCNGSELELLIDAEWGNADLDGIFTSDILRVYEVNALDEESFDWMPNACAELNTEVTFKSINAETIFTLVDRTHHIYREELGLTDRRHNVTYIDQRNETIEIGYVNDLFSPDTIFLELRSIIYSFDDQTPDPKIDQLTIYSPRSNTNVYNFSKTFNLEDRDFDFSDRTFHESIELNDQVFNSVIEFKLSPNVWLEPHTRLYLNKELGFFGFEKDQVLWLRE